MKRRGRSDNSFIFPLVFVPLLLAVVFIFLSIPRNEEAEEVLPKEPDNVVINEICTKNNSLFIDAESLACDYVELYNPTDREVDISGWYLSDNPDVLAKCRLEGTVMEPGDFYVIYLDGSIDFITEQFFSGPIQGAAAGETVRFALSSKSDEILSLCTPDLEIADSVLIPPVGEDLTWSRISDGALEWGIRTATPYRSNNDAGTELLPLPEPAVISEFSDRRWTVSVTMRDEDLYDYETGIYTQGIVWDRFEEQDISDTGYKETDIALHSNWKMGWKRRARIQIFDDEGSMIDDRAVHVACHGNTSVADESKSLSVYADEGEFDLFDDNSGQKTILLRNGGSERFQTKLRDPVLQAAAKGLNLSVQDFITCDVYLNGEYMGPYLIMEKYGADYLAKHYDIDPDSAVILKNPVGASAGYSVEGNRTDFSDFISLWTYAKTHDLSDPECYDYVCRRMDIDSFTDYIAVEMYIANLDVYPNNNVYVWRVNPSPYTDDTNPYNDGRWRFMLQDLDASSGADISFDCYEPDDTRQKLPIKASVDTVVTNLVAWEGEGNESNFVTDPLFAGLMQREDFREKFTERLHYIAENNYEASRVAELMEEAYHQINYGWVERSGLSKEVLKEYVAEFNEFFEKRSDYIFDYLEEDFAPPEEDDEEDWEE